MQRGDFAAFAVLVSALGVACQSPPPPERVLRDSGAFVEADGGDGTLADGGSVDDRPPLACAPLEGPGCAPDSSYAERLAGFCCLNRTAQTFTWWRAENTAAGPRFIAHRTPAGGPFAYYDAPLAELAVGIPPSFEDPAVTRSFVEAEARVVSSASASGERVVLTGEGMRSTTIPLRYGVLTSTGFVEAFSCQGTRDLLSAGPGPGEDSVSLLFRSSGLCVPECVDENTHAALFDVDLNTGSVVGPRCLLPGSDAYGVFHPRQRLFAAIAPSNAPVRVVGLDEAGNATVTHTLPGTMSGSLQFWPLREDRLVFRAPASTNSPSAWTNVTMGADGAFAESAAEFDAYLDLLIELVPGSSGATFAIGRPRAAIADPARWWVVVRVGSDGGVDHALVPRTQVDMVPQVVEWEGRTYAVIPVLPAGGMTDQAGNRRPNVILYRALSWSNGER